MSIKRKDQPMKKWAVICLLAVTALTGCGSDNSAELSTAVNKVQMPLRSIWPQSYAGIDVDKNKLVIYRKPDAALDAYVRERVENVGIDFRDAPYSLKDLEPLAERVRVDWHYWSTQQQTIKMVTPRPDGTGVNVVLATENLDTAKEQFRKRYGEEPIILHLPARTGIAPAR